MNDMQKNAELLDTFFDDLVRDSQAAAPIKLDTELTILTRSVVASERGPAPPDVVQSRIWQDVLTNAASTEMRVILRSRPRRVLWPHPKWSIVSPRRFSSLVALLTFALVLAAVSASAAGLLRVYRPESTPAMGAQSLASVIAPPLLPPPNLTNLHPADPAQVARDSGRVIAYLPIPSAEANATTDVDLLPESAWSDPNTIGIAIRSIVRYRGSSHTVLVMLEEPSPAMAREKQLSLGERTIRLADGQEAWVSTRPNWPVENVVATVTDRYVIVVASDLSPETVAMLTSQVILSPASGRGSPSAGAMSDTSNAPRSTDTALGPTMSNADLEVAGTVNLHKAENNQSRLSYSIKLGNRGGSIANTVQVMIELPPVLASHALTPPNPISFDAVGAGALVGFGGDITFDVSGIDPASVQRAVAAGITVRVRWTDNGQQQERTFLVQ